RHTIYLDFDGVDVTAESTWSTNASLAPGTYEGWDPMGDGPGLTDAERTAIQDIWARVAEDFAPFDVDVTTADPGDGALRYDGTEYYTGHGTWAPIMGNGYNAPVTQWSRGFYAGANNNQNDVAIIGAITGFRTDEGGDGWASPLRVTDATAYVTSEVDGDVYL